MEVLRNNFVPLNWPWLMTPNLEQHWVASKNLISQWYYVWLEFHWNGGCVVAQFFNRQFGLQHIFFNWFNPNIPEEQLKDIKLKVEGDRAETHIIKVVND